RRPVVAGAQRPGGDGARAPALGGVARRALADALVQARAERLLENLLGGDTLAQDLAGRGRVVEPEDVPTPDVRRRDGEPLGDAVELRLGRELGLRRAETPKRAVRRRVRPGRPAAEADVRAAIWAAGVGHAARQAHGGDRAVRGAVHDDPG